jgi:asparagine N-glycosylation enzyme membrane subunit Stt3
MAEHITSIDDAAGMSHRHLMGALLVIFALGLAAVLSLTTAGADAGQILWRVMPGILVVTAASLHRMYKRVDTRAMKAMRNDELRQASLARAWRNGFFAVLAAQPLLGFGLTWSGAAHGIGLMIAGTVCIGGGVALTTLQWYDR